jgi:hypothetical protein
MPEPIKDKLIIYYSYSGNNKLLAEHFSRELDAPAVPILEKERRNGFTIFLDVFFKRNPEVMPLSVSLSDFKHLIFIAPIWNGKIASPLKSLLQNQRAEIKSYSFLTISGGYEKKDQLDKIRIELKKLTGLEPASLYELDISDLFPQSQRKNIRKISGYHVRPEDLANSFKLKIQDAVKFQKELSIS